MDVLCLGEEFVYERIADEKADFQLPSIQPQHAKRLRMQLVALDTASTIDDMDIPGFKLHSLKGANHDRWSVWVNGNWRVTFEFRDGHAFILDYEDYH